MEIRDSYWEAGFRSIFRNKSLGQIKGLIAKEGAFINDLEEEAKSHLPVSIHPDSAQVHDLTIDEDLSLDYEAGKWAKLSMAEKVTLKALIKQRGIQDTVSWILDEFDIRIDARTAKF
jgi:hypothetical protein